MEENRLNATQEDVPPEHMCEETQDPHTYEVVPMEELPSAGATKTLSTNERCGPTQYESLQASSAKETTEYDELIQEEQSGAMATYMVNKTNRCDQTLYDSVRESTALQANMKAQIPQQDSSGGYVNA